MNKENAKDFLPLVQALADRKTIQFNDGGDWVDVENLNTDSYNPDEYRIKPEPRTFKVWRSPNGTMTPLTTEPPTERDFEWECITVQEVI